MNEYKMVLFDVDGTLVTTKSGKEFRVGAADWQLLPGREEILERLHESGVRTALVSNQGGVAFGYLTEVEIFHELSSLAAALGIDPHAVYYCPDHPKATLPQYRRDTIMRKPGAGMLWTAMGYAGVRMSEALMVGDRPEDAAAAETAGCDFQSADEYFPASTSGVHEWVYIENGGKSGYCCQRCGVYRGPSEEYTPRCSGVFDSLRAHVETQLEDELSGLRAALNRPAPTTSERGEQL